MKHVVSAVLAVILLLLAGCVALPPTPQPGPATSPTLNVPTAISNQPSRTPKYTPGITEENRRVEISISGKSAETRILAPVGSNASILISFRPTKDVTENRAGNTGPPLQYSTDWTNHSIKLMRYCAGVGRNCSLPVTWVPFSNESQVTVAVDWVGPLDYVVTAQFRDAAGQLIPAGSRSEMTGSNSVSIVGTFDERTPAALQPPVVQTVIADTQKELPIRGSIKVGSADRMGARAGATVEIPVQFSASGPVGPATEMRTKESGKGSCLAPREMADAKWEPFASIKVFLYRVSINWTTFHLNVQYRDAQANLSPVYCGEIAVEGSP